MPRSRRKAQKARHALAAASPPVPPPPELPLREDLARGIRTPAFRSAVVRQLILLVGVFALGWPALDIALFFLLETFLFLSLRAAAEISLDERYGVMARTPAAVAWEIAKHWLVAAPIIAMVVGTFGLFGVVPAFSEEAWAAFRERGIRDPGFLGSLVLLAGSIVYDTALFARRVALGRDPAERARDDLGIRVALARVLGLAMAGFALSMAARVGVGPQAITVAIAGVMLFVEAVPHRAARPFAPSGA